MSVQVSKKLRSLVKGALPRDLYNRFRANQTAKGLLNEARQHGAMAFIRELVDSLNSESTDDYIARNWHRGTETEVAFPGIGLLEINDTCNLDCLSCRTPLSSRKKGIMNLDVFERSVERMARRGDSQVRLHTVGDPLMNKNLGHYLAILRKHKMYVAELSSNCLLLDRHLETLFEYRDVIDCIRPSIDGATKETYERIRVNGKFEKLHHNLMRLAERNAKEARPLPIWIQCTFSKDNFHELAYVPWAYSYVCPPELVDFNAVLTMPLAREYVMKMRYFEDAYRKLQPCPRAFGQPHVLKDGSLTACCIDFDGDLVFGHIDDGPLEQTFNNDRARALRAIHLGQSDQPMPPVCAECHDCDGRYDKLITAVIRYFYLHVRKHPAHLQMALNRIGPMMNRREFDEALKVAMDL